MTRDYLPAKAVTSGPKHHFFGYYDKCPWNASGSLMLAMQVEFNDRLPEPEDVAIIGIIDLTSKNRFSPIAETRAWNFQQGAMLQWVPSAPDKLIIYNDRDGDHFVSVVLDINSGDRRILPRPVSTLSHNGQFALSVNYARLYQTKPGYGYAGLPDPWEDDPYPEDDGIYLIDLSTGKYRLILSLAEVANFGHCSTISADKHWFNSLLFNPDDTRFCFLHRLQQGDDRFYTSLFTANLDGSDLYCLAGGMVSHFHWCNPHQLLAWSRARKIIGLPSQEKIVGLARHRFFDQKFLQWILARARRRSIGWIRQNIVGDRFALFTDQTGHIEEVGKGVLAEDGHCSYSPKGQWILMDTYPHEDHQRALILYNHLENRRVNIGRFYSLPELEGDIRCDLHARWKRDGREVCIDSAHEGSRQMYVLDVRNIVQPGQ